MRETDERGDLLTATDGGLLRWHLSQVRRPWSTERSDGSMQAPAMHLSTLLAGLSLDLPSGVPDVELSGFATDSRHVGPGTLFAAVRGETTSGAEFIEDALGRGAAAVLVEAGDGPSGTGVPTIGVPDLRDRLGRLAATLHQHPSEMLDVVGVTGTNGKTTTATLARAALERAGRHAGLIGTTGYETGLGSYAASNTTPAVDRVHALLAEMRDAGQDSCVLEVSSHALVQGRVDDVHFRCGVFTNLSREHLDYHGTMEEYLDAKAELFRRLPKEAVCVLNRDDPAWELLAAETLARVVTFGTGNGGDYRARILRMDEQGTGAEVATPVGTVHLQLGLLGLHNLANALGALAAAVALGADPEQAAQGISAVHSVSGRVERVPVPAPFTVLVDYAHTDDALQRVLRHLRPLVSGRLIVVFGCGGDRDPGKRPLMARAAELHADGVVVTTDNPRHENAMDIIRDVMTGFQEPARVLIEPDRAEAIALAVGLAQEGDLVLVAGKGHESSQIVGAERLPFDDRQAVMACFSSP